MKGSGVVHLVGALIAALYLLAGSPVAAQYTMVPLSDDSTIQFDKAASPATATITADISACLGGEGPFAILGEGGPPNTTVIFKVTQTVPNVLGFSNSGEPGSFTVTINIPVTLDGAGNGQSDPFYIRGVGLGQTEVSICNDQQGCARPFNPATAIVVNVASVEWEAVNSTLDDNPPSIGEGQRIFPEKTTPNDNEDRTLVRVKVTLSAEHSRLLGVRVFDVDDPSSDTAPVDRNGSAGNDNRRRSPSLGITGEGFGSAVAGPDGVARFNFFVSKQPGDNFRVGAACHLVDRDGLAVDGTGIKDSEGRPLPTDFAKITPLLTVWRRLHIEVDTMEAVHDNFVEGTVDKARETQKGTTVLTLTPFDEYAAGLADSGRFAPGRITVDGVSFPVTRHRGNTVYVQGTFAQNPANRIFRLVDDDDFNDDDGVEWDGDEGEVLPEPDQSWVKHSDLPAENFFAPAYVKPTYDLSNPNPKSPFVQNYAGTAEVPIFTYPSFDNSGSSQNRDFWTAYLLGAYQPPTGEDNDGEEVAIWGYGDPTGASVFLENGRPWETDRYKDKADYVNEAATTAHELGHWFDLPNCNSKNPDPEGGLMCGPDVRRKGSFSSRDLHGIRCKGVPAATCGNAPADPQ